MSNPSETHDQPETEFIGETQQFSGAALLPDNPSMEPRERKGRPNDGQPQTIGELREKDNE